MNPPRIADRARRNFLAQAGGAGLAAFLGSYKSAVAADPPTETPKIRLLHVPAICHAPQYLAEELLRLEGFSEIEYVPFGTRYIPDALAEGQADMTMWNALELIPHIDVGKPVVVLAGIHGGCFELFGNESVQSIRDLKGRKVAITYHGGGDHIMLSSMLSYVGANPADVNWMGGRESLLDAMDLFVRGQADAFVGFAQQPVELRARKIGHVIVDTSRDRPWSQYYCCVLAANKDFVRRYPVASKRALRAILKAADACDANPLKVARYLSDNLYEPRFTIGLDVIKRLSYNRWREANPEDTLRFYSLRLREVAMIRSSPQKIIDQGTDWRFLNELKRELKT
jgi:NitT/TauT family transport system substrate-binding protein